MAQVQQRLRAAERALAGAEALRDDVGQVVIHHVLLGGHHLREALHAKRLSRGRRHQQDVRHRGNRVRCLDIQRDLERPGGLVFESSAVALTRRRLRRRTALQGKLAERRHAGRAAHALFATHRL